MPEYPHHRFTHACFSRPRVADGLPVKSVYALFQDSVGFVWVGTQTGLVRLDGHSARRFQYDPEDPCSVPGKFILGLGEDPGGDIWVGTYEGGCARYDRYRERFTGVDLHPWNEADRVARCFESMGDGRMWVGTHGSLTAIDLRSGKVRKFRHPEAEDAPAAASQRFTALLPLDDRTLLVGTAAGAFFFDTRRESFRAIPFDDRAIPVTSGHGVTAIIRREEEVILATGRQVYRLTESSNVLELMEPLVNHPSYGARFAITSLAADSVASRLWIGTSIGLLRQESDGENFSFFPSDDTDPRAPHGPGTQALLRDRSGMLWIGAGSGVSLLDLRYNFQYHRLIDDSLHGPLAVSGITRDDDGVIWLATPTGLWEYDPHTTRQLRHSLGGESEQVQRENNSVRQVHRGKRHLWVGSVNGLFQWDPDSRTVVNRYQYDPTAAASGAMRSVLGPSLKGIVEDHEGFVWSGSDVAGMQRLDPHTGLFRYYRKGAPGSGSIPHDTVLTSLEDDRGRLWFGFVTCLARYDRESDSFESFSHDPGDRMSLSNNMVMALHQDGRGRLWVGTASGLNRIVEHEDGSLHVVRYGLREGLPADFIVSIVEHGDELWLGTNRGIIRFHEGDGAIQARLYDTSDGLHASEYNLCSAMHDDGHLYFGGGFGFDRFRPDRILPDNTPPPVVLTELRLFNEPVAVVPGRAGESHKLALERSITHLRDLSLSYRHSVVTFCYAALHYRQPEKIRYRYRLDGFDRDWIDAGGKTEATYTNLDPGKYLFRVKAANSDGVWSEECAELAVRVEPPPWRTWWAHTLYGLAGAGAIAQFTRWRIALNERELREQRRVEQAREEERENIRRQNAADFHDEAGTTLTRILFLTELARRHGESTDELRGLLEKIDANTTRLAQGMRDFIWVLDPDKDTLLDTLQRIGTVGESLFTTVDTSFTMSYDHRRMEGVSLNLDQRRQILMICKEVLHNAVRHAHAETVRVLASLGDGTIIISIIDDGCGYSPGTVTAGYGTKSMRTRAASIGAELLVESTPEIGTHVTLKIPHMSD